MTKTQDYIRFYDTSGAKVLVLPPRPRRGDWLRMLFGLYRPRIIVHREPSPLDNDFLWVEPFPSGGLYGKVYDHRLDKCFTTEEYVAKLRGSDKIYTAVPESEARKSPIARLRKTLAALEKETE